MARATPQVEQGAIRVGSPGEERSIQIGTSDWYAWLETATSFAFSCPAGAFTARRERASTGRGGWYWRAYQRRSGELRRAYLGRAPELTLDRLQEVAAALASAALSDQQPQHLTARASRPAQGQATPSAPAAPGVPLLTTKLYVPQVRATLVARPQLLKQLQASLAGKLTLITAPAGFGKTTLLAAWLAALRLSDAEAPRAAWLALDAADNDPAAFLRYLIAALQAIAPGFGSAALKLLSLPQLPPLDAISTAILNDAATLPHAALLVLDDYHVIATPALHQALAFLLDHLPPALHLVIATREDPPLPVARLRARGQLTELRAGDLRFTPEEAAIFLTSVMRLPLTAEQISTLELRTEGWIAGLQFAALAMRDHRDIEGFISAFAGSHRFVVDYLVEEVLRQQPPHLQAFLLQTSILDRLCAPLCDAVLGVETRAPAGDAYSQLLLLELERRNLFLVPLDDDRMWYRYHHLFAEVLRARLQHGAAATEVAALHQRASRWHEEHQLIPEAVQHALASREAGRAVELIERNGLILAGAGQRATVIAWLGALPEPEIRRRPLLCFVAAVLLMGAQQFGAAEERLGDAERCLDHAASDGQRRAIHGQILLARASLARLAGTMHAAVALADRALPLLPEDQMWLRAVAALIVARSFQSSGDVSAAAERQLSAAVGVVRDVGNLPAARTGLAILGQLRALQGRRRQAAVSYLEAIELLKEHPDQQHQGGAADCLLAYGEWLREQGQLEDAERQLRAGMALIHGPETIEAETILCGAISLARTRQAHGDGAGAHAALALFGEATHNRAVDPALLGRAEAAAAWLQLMRGDLAAAARWAGGRAGMAGLNFPHEYEQLTLVRVSIAQRRLEPGLAILAQLLEAAEAGGRMGSAIEILTLQALARSAHASIPEALGSLQRALALAEPEGYVRIFLDEGPPMAALLREARARGIAPAYLTALLAAFPEPDAEARGHGADTTAGSPPLVEALTSREREVLRLLASGASNDEIAAALVISIGTTKKHVTNILGKLAVRSRTQAAIWAREHGLLAEQSAL